MKRHLKNLFLVIGGIFLGLLLCEIGLRVLGGGRFKVYRPNPERTVFWHYDSLLGWKHLANQEGRFINSDSNVQVKISGQGLRDKYYPYEPPRGVVRILVLGDSFTWGFGVEEDEIFTEILESMEPRLEVINMGVSGYSTDQEYLLLREEGVKYRPDIVLVMFFENDIYENLSSVNYFIYPKPRFTLIGDRLTLTHLPEPRIGLFRRAHYFLRTHFVTYNVPLRVYAYSQEAPIRFLREEVSQWTNLISGKEDEDPVKLITAIFDEINRLSMKHRFKLVIVKIATHKQAVRYERTKLGGVEKYAGRQRIPFLDLGGPFNEHILSHPNTRLQFDHDRHWNVKAHKLAAEVIYEYLRREGLIPMRRAPFPYR